MPILMREVERYLAFWDAVKGFDDDDRLWREYEGWQKLTEKRNKLVERCLPYSLKDEEKPDVTPA